jgi:hypothetical protein
MPRCGLAGALFLLLSHSVIHAEEVKQRNMLLLFSDEPAPAARVPERPSLGLRPVSPSRRQHGVSLRLVSQDELPAGVISDLREAHAGHSV